MNRVTQHTRVLTIAFLLVVLSLNGPVMGAKYAGEAFTLGASARALGVGGAYVALASDATGIYYNPAGLAGLKRDQVVLLHSETFGSLVNHDFIAYGRPARLAGSEGALAMGIYRVGGGGIKLTEWDPQRGRPIVTSEVSHYDYLLLLGGGFQLSSNWRLGSTLKVIIRSLGDESAYGIGLDLGLQYQVHSDLVLALQVTNATSSFISYDNGTRESILPAVKLGGAYRRQVGRFSVGLLVDGEFLFEGRQESAQFWAGEVSLDTRFGVEVGYYDLVFFRAGSDIGKMALGIGVKYDRFALDGAFLDHEDLDNSYRMSLIVSF